MHFYQSSLTEDKAIIEAIKSVFPKVVNFFVLHQLKNVSQKYSDEFNHITNISDSDEFVYNEICHLISSDMLISVAVCFQNNLKLDSNLEL